MRDTVEMLKALADPTRMRVVALLAQVPGGTCVCELVDALRLPQYLVSRHLSVLRAAGLVEGRRDGTWMLYRLPQSLPEPAASMVRALGEHLTGEPVAEDRRRLRQRLGLRRRGKCVVGYDPPRPYREVIPPRLPSPNERMTRHAQER